MVAGDSEDTGDIKGLSNKNATKVFFYRTKTVMDINKILYCYKSDIMIETRFLLHAHHGHVCRSPDAERNF